MNMDSVKEALYDITQMFFNGATVIWTEQIATKPTLPYVTLKIGAVNKSTFAVTDDEGNSYYPCNTKAEINLYTKGKPVNVGDNVTGNYVNTATSDMLDFIKFIESDEMVDYLAAKGVDFLLIPPVRDLTALENDSRYRYRSMAEATLSWSEEASGPYGIRDMVTVPNSSGGGTTEMSDAINRTIEDIEITETIEGGQN